MSAKPFFTLPKLSKDILWSTFVQLGGKALQMGMGIVTVKLMTSALGTENYGTYGKISEFSLFFATMANLGIFGNMVRRVALEPHNKSLFGNALLLRFFTGLLFFGVGWLYATLTIDNPVFLLGTLFFMGSLLLDFLTTVCDALLQVHYKMGRATFALVLGRATNLAVIYSLSLMLERNPDGLSVQLYLLGPLLASVVTVSLSFFFARRLVKPSWRVDKNLLKDLFWTSLPFGIINIANNLYFRFLPSAFLAVVLTNANFGIYTLSLHLASVLSLLSTLFMFSVLPKFEQSLKKKDWTSARSLYRNAQKFLAFACLALVGFGTWIGPWALSLVSSKDFVSPETWFILPLLLILAGVSYFYDLALLTLFALKEELWWLRREVLALGLCLVFGLTAHFMADRESAAILILTGAIAAEAAMAHWGMQRAKRLLNTSR